MCKDLSDLSKDFIITFRSSLVLALAANSISLSMLYFLILPDFEKVHQQF